MRCGVLPVVEQALFAADYRLLRRKSLSVSTPPAQQSLKSASLLLALAVFRIVLRDQRNCTSTGIPQRPALSISRGKRG